MKKILFVTGSRADYGLLKKIIFKFQEDSNFETHVAATGAHISKAHGQTVNVLKEDGVSNLHEVDLQINGDAPSDINRAIAQGVLGFNLLLNTLKPNLLIVLGDRYELWPATIAATIFNIPIAHLHGGESTEGLIDESVRHSVTKMSHLHFCSHDQYRKRIIGMGEQPSTVFNVGAIGLDRIKEMTFMNKSSLEKSLDIAFGKKNILCTFHPVTLNEEESTNETDSLMKAIEQIILKNKDYKFFISLPNADTFSSYISNRWNEIMQKYPSNIIGFSNLGDLRYLSLMKNADLVLGNSSSGILEAPYLNKAIVNIGRRQEGRLSSKHIIHAKGNYENIIQAIEKGLSPKFQESLATFSSIYGNGVASDEIHRIISITSLDNLLFKKFYEENV